MCVNNQLPVFPTEKVKECVMIVNVMETVTFHEQENHYGAGDVTGQDDDSSSDILSTCWY